MSAIIIDNELVHYEVLGRGKPVLFLHSWIGTWRYWISVMQSASIGFRTYALDLWGFGDSAKNKKYSINDQAQLILQFLEKLGILRIAVVGHGLGGIVALELAKIMPEVVDRIFAISVPFTNDLMTSRLLKINLSENVDSLFPQDQTTKSLNLDMQKIDQGIISAISDPSNQFNKYTLDNLKVNCLFGFGKEDPFVLPPPITILNQIPENHHAILFDQSGHFPMLEENSIFGRLLIDFLSLDSGKSMQELNIKEEWKRRLR